MYGISEQVIFLKMSAAEIKNLRLVFLFLFLFFFFALRDTNVIITAAKLDQKE